MANVFNRKGGSQSGRDGNLHPDSVERLALGVAIAVRLAYVRTGMTSSINFRLTVGEEVKRSGATRHQWPDRTILNDVFYLMFHKMNDAIIEKFIKYQFKPLKGLTGDARELEEKVIAKDIVQLCLYLLLATIRGLCFNWPDFKARAEEAKLDTLLKNKILGGHEEWVRHQLIGLGQCLGQLLGQLLGPRRPALARIGPPPHASARVGKPQPAPQPEAGQPLPNSCASRRPRPMATQIGPPGTASDRLGPPQTASDRLGPPRTASEYPGRPQPAWTNASDGVSAHLVPRRPHLGPRQPSLALVDNVPACPAPPWPTLASLGSLCQPAPPTEHPTCML